MFDKSRLVIFIHLLLLGRHPLTEKLVETFIPNDTHMGLLEGRVQVITGVVQQLQERPATTC